jgi:glycosyltransferase involved in cell wall biosynthesis
MKSLILSYSDTIGGAARAAFRLLKSLRHESHDTSMLVTKKISDSPHVKVASGRFSKPLTLLKPTCGQFIQRLQKTNNPILHSGNWLRSHLLKSIADMDVDVLNMHWVNHEMLSIAQISSLGKPMVMTLHDMWAFCGSEHYTVDSKECRFRQGYTKETRPIEEKGLDLNRFVWQRKKKHWKKPFHIITPSSWLSNCARESALFKDWPIHTVPNPLDTSSFKPLDKKMCRELLDLPLDKKLIGFGALGGTADKIKGFDLLAKSLRVLSVDGQLPGAECVIFGQAEPITPPNLGFPLNFMGHLHDDVALVLLYNALDVMIVPSRQENLPQTGTEAHACGTPVVAFDTTGFRDVVEHKETGYLAETFNTDDLAQGIAWCLEDSDRQIQLGIKARERALTLWSPEVVIPQYVKIYQQAIDDFEK